jgi:predicted amidohydrolase YtcJ
MSTFAIAFAAAFAVLYVLAVENNWALFTYHPAAEEFHFLVKPAKDAPGDFELLAGSVYVRRRAVEYVWNGRIGQVKTIRIGVGGPAKPGSASYRDASGEYRISASGENIWGARDSFHFLSKPITGDLEITAMPAWAAAGGNAHKKAGIMLRAGTIKFFADGVIEMGTGYLLEPYEDAPHTCGLPNWSPEELSEAVTAFDADGFQIHIHAIGDGGVRMALDAIEVASVRNGPRDRRPVIAHTQVVQGVDRSRFASLGVIANFEPLWACLDPTMEELTLPRLGPERSALQYPIATIARAGAHISFGSDWPVSSMHPLHGLAVAVTRQNRDGKPDGGWLPEERLPITQALAAYTAGTAYQGFEDDMGGVIAEGRRADLCVLSADISAMAGREVADVAVTGTWTGGREVHAS